MFDILKMCANYCKILIMARKKMALIPDNNYQELLQDIDGINSLFLRFSLRILTKSF